MMLVPLRTSRRAPRRAPRNSVRRCFLADRQPQIAELPIHGSGRAILDAGDASAVQIENGERFEHIVELPGCEGNGDVLAFANAAKMFEVADAALVENDAFDWK